MPILTTLLEVLSNEFKGRQMNKRHIDWMKINKPVLITDDIMVHIDNKMESKAIYHNLAMLLNSNSKYNTNFISMYFLNTTNKETFFFFQQRNFKSDAI